jgi:hypothetical protein
MISGNGSILFEEICLSYFPSAARMSRCDSDFFCCAAPAPVQVATSKIDEYARGMISGNGSTLFEELGLYYIGPLDGHNLDDLVTVLNDVRSADTVGPVLVHVITEKGRGYLPAETAQVGRCLSDACFLDACLSGFWYSNCRCSKGVRCGSQLYKDSGPLLLQMLMQTPSPA